MDLDGIRLFCRVVELGSISKAAAQLHISQPAASHRIRVLEMALGHPLLERASRGIRVTPEGMLAYRTFREVVDRLEGLLATLDGRPKGRLRVGTVCSVGLHVLPPIVKAFRLEYPQCLLQLEFGSVHGISRATEQGLFDLAVLPFAEGNRGLQCTPLFQDDLVLIAPGWPAFQEGGPVEPARLQGLPMVAWRQGTASRKRIDAVLARHGLHLKVATELSSLESIKRAVEAELGVAIVHRCGVAGDEGRRAFRILPIRGEGFTYFIGALRSVRRPETPALHAFLQVLHQEAEKAGLRPAG